MPNTAVSNLLTPIGVSLFLHAAAPNGTASFKSVSVLRPLSLSMALPVSMSPNAVAHARPGILIGGLAVTLTRVVRRVNYCPPGRVATLSTLLFSDEPFNLLHDCR